MLHQPRRWLPGLLPLALLAGGSLWWKQAAIEKDLGERAASAMAAAGASIDGKPWAGATAYGRDVVVTGEAPAESAAIAAATAAAGVFGVRQAVVDADLIPAANPFGWSARREGSTITLSGQVAADGSRARLVEAARQAVPGGEISDLMTVARDVPPGASAAALLGIAQLGRVESGSASLAGTVFRFTGWTADEAARAAIAAALAELPQGISAAGVHLQPPTPADDGAPPPEAIMPAAPAPAQPAAGDGQAGAAAPAQAAGPAGATTPPAAPPRVEWSATKAQDGALTIAGAVGSEEARQRIIDAALASTTGPVIDALAVVEGTPPAVEAKALAALKQLERLAAGTARIAGTVYSLTGIAATPEALDSLAGETGAASDGFTIGELAIAPPRIEPFTWTVRKAGDALTLGGFAPSAEARAAALAAASRLAGGARVVDEMRLAAGLPDGVAFAALAEAALAQLGRLDEGTVQLIGNRLMLSGRAPDVATAVSIREALAGLQVPVTAISDIALPAAQIPPPVEAPPLSADLIAPPQPPGAAPAPSGAAPASSGSAPAPAPSQPAALAPRPDCSAMLQTALEGDRILFDYWKAEQRAEHGPVLDRLAATLKRCAPDERIEVAGHADIHNRTNQNQKLSEDRAAVMRDELVRRGVPAGMLVVAGYAETRPVAPNDTEDNRALNRRVEFHVLPRN